MRDIKPLTEVIKSINEAAKKIYDYHNESVISFREMNIKKNS